MKICIPTTDDHGLDSKAHGHVGGAPFYAILDTETEDVRIVRNVHRRHDKGECGPGAHIRGLHVDAVICAEIGRRAFASLEESGVEVLVSDKETVGEILLSRREDKLRRMTAEQACRGHGPNHGACHGTRRP